MTPCGQLARLPDPDAEFAAALARSPSVIAFVYSDDAQLTDRPRIDLRYSVAVIGPDGAKAAVLDQVRGGAYAVLPLPAIMQTVHGLGEVQAGEPDVDGVVRRVPLLVRVGDELFNTFAGDVLRIGLGGQTTQVRVTPDGFIDKMRIGEAILPVNGRGELLLYDTGIRAERRISLADIFASGVDASHIAGHLVLVGATATAFQDIRTTPNAPYMPGVEIHAQILEQILGNQYLSRPYDADRIEIGYLAIFGLVLLGFPLSSQRHRRRNRSGRAVAVTIAASWWQFADKGSLFDPIYPALAAIGHVQRGTLVNYLRTEREKQFVRSAMAHYLSPVLADRVSQHPEQLKLGGELRELTMMFCDIRGFTKMSESLDPQALTGLINSLPDADDPG